MEQAQWFKNETVGHIGAVKFNAEGRREAVSVPPGGTVELTEAEMRLTAAAPMSPSDNPLVHGGPGDGPALRRIDQGLERPTAPPDRVAEPGEPTHDLERQAADERGAAPFDQAVAAQGTRDSREEVGTPPAA